MRGLSNIVSKKFMGVFGLLLFGVCHLLAVETLLIGDVVSEQTGEPIPNAHVYFRGTKIGTTTDTTGAFVLHIDLNATLKLKVSALGFHSELYEITPGTTAGMYVALRERTTELSDVFIVPGMNPAIALIDSIRAHAPVDHQRTLSDTEPNIECYFLRRKSVDSAPLSFAEALGVPIPSRPDFYSTLIPIGSASILSPLARSGNAYYNYYLADSMVMNQRKQYRIDFIPRHGADPLLRGKLFVDSATYRLERIESSLPYHANINFVRALSYSADYQQGYMLSDSLDLIYDFSAYRDSLSKMPALRLIKTTPKPPQPPLGGEVISPVGSMGQQTIIETPHPPREPEGLSSEGLSSPIYRTAEWLAYAIQTGYLSTGTWLDLGNYTEFLRYSDYEGLHLGLPFRTNEKLMPHVSLEGYVAYGFRDRGVKWKAAAKVLLTTERRQLLGAYAWDRYVYREVGEFSDLARENRVCDGNQTFTSYLFGDVFNLRPQRYANSAARRREYRLWWEADWCPSDGALPAVETKLSFSHNRQGIGEACRGMQYNTYPMFRFTETAAVVRLSWGEKTKDIFTTRRHFYSRYPTLWLGASLGSWTEDDRLEVGRMFGRLNATVRQNIPLGIGGELDYLVSAGLVLGKVPTDLLDYVDGGTGVTFDSNRFTLLGRNTLCSNRYLKIQTDWNGHGILFNRIPYVCRAKLRELAEVKLAWANLQNARSIPYMELGVGIGNILSFGEVWCVARLTQHEQWAEQPWVACRFRFKLGL